MEIQVHLDKVDIDAAIRLWLSYKGLIVGTRPIHIQITEGDRPGDTGVLRAACTAEQKDV